MILWNTNIEIYGTIYMSIISTAIKLIKYNLTDESKFEITEKDFMEQLH
jgi:prolipoprotein diacylglyceryltransferase